MVEKTVEWKKVCEDHVDSMFLQFQGKFTDKFEERVRRLFLEVIVALEEPLALWLGRLESIVIVECGCLRRLIGLEPLPKEKWEDKFQIIFSASACEQSDKQLKALFCHEIGHLVMDHAKERERLGKSCIDRQEKQAEKFRYVMGF